MSVVSSCTWYLDECIFNPKAEFFRKFEGMAESGHKKKADSSFKDTEVEVECSFVHKGLKGATRRLSRGMSSQDLNSF